MNKPTIYLKDYKAPSFSIKSVDLTVDLHQDYTRVSSHLEIIKQSADDQTLILNAEQLKLLEVLIDERQLSSDEYQYDDHQLIIAGITQNAFRLTTVCQIQPQLNTSLMGLYQSNGIYCTQCEAEGFRKITPYLDRPDVLASFTVTLIGNSIDCPVLLSNGNPIEAGNIGADRHFVKWHDPIAKPCYLFALVAGKLSCIEDSFTTMSGRQVAIRFYVEHKDLDKCEHALGSLKRAMQWDQEVYGREYDLDIFMVVAVDDFNMGAMENKGLNIFNTSAVLANPSITTDARFQWIEAVVAHEYFHNWSGNRVTCRDWFQLSLKEGFTVFRDSQFSADMGSASVKRIEDVKLLLNHQFAEDAGPLAHPVQPNSFVEINNFYTLTVYEKGAEIVRMIHQILGQSLFREGSDLYFERHDGQAVTIEDFVQAMADVSTIDFSQFMLWYRQAGTPEVTLDHSYDAVDQTLKLAFTQSSRFDDNKPYWIPIKMALLSPTGKPITVEGNASYELMLNVTKKSQTFEFNNIKELPLISILRNFSAPIKLKTDFSESHLLAIMAHDDDGYSQWNAAQQIAIDWLQRVQVAIQRGTDKPVNQGYIDALGFIIASDSIDNAMKSLILQLPTEGYLAEISEIIDTESIHQARNFVKKTIANTLKQSFKQNYYDCQSDAKYAVDASQIGQRSLKNACLAYWLTTADSEALEATASQFKQASNMTDCSAALGLLIGADGAEIGDSLANSYADQAIAEFYERWQHENLAINIWLAAQAQSSHSETLGNIKRLLNHPIFSINNPNKVRALIGNFVANQHCFNDASGAGYEFVADIIIQLNSINPQIAARMTTAFMHYKKLPDDKAKLMEQAMQRIQRQQLSPDVAETLGRILG